MNSDEFRVVISERCPGDASPTLYVETHGDMGGRSREDVNQLCIPAVEKYFDDFRRVLPPSNIYLIFLPFTVTPSLAPLLMRASLHIAGWPTWPWEEWPTGEQPILRAVSWMSQPTLVKRGCSPWSPGWLRRLFDEGGAKAIVAAIGGDWRRKGHGSRTTWKTCFEWGHVKLEVTGSDTDEDETVVMPSVDCMLDAFDRRTKRMITTLVVKF